MNDTPSVDVSRIRDTRAITEELPRRIWGWVHKELRAEGVSDEHAMARADLVLPDEPVTTTPTVSISVAMAPGQFGRDEGERP